MHRLPLVLLAAGALAACAGGDDAAPADRAAAVDSTAPDPAPTPAAAAAWRANPADGVTLRQGDTLVVETGPHAVLWREGAEALAPPYTVRATLHKRMGRLNEGYGLVFGGTALDGPETGQAYSYFLVRGDGSWLVKRRDGAQTPIVADWTRHPAVRRDGDAAGARNELAVHVGADTVAFVVNGDTVTRVPAAALTVRGTAGLRVAHDVVVAVEQFRAAGDAP